MHVQEVENKKKQAKTAEVLVFFAFGFFNPVNPRTTLAATVVWVLICCAGFPQTEFTTDPVELWVNPDSQNAHELNFYRKSEWDSKTQTKKSLENQHTSSQHSFIMKNSIRFTARKWLL